MLRSVTLALAYLSLCFAPPPRAEEPYFILHSSLLSDRLFWVQKCVIFSFLSQMNRGGPSASSSSAPSTSNPSSSSILPSTSSTNNDNIHSANTPPPMNKQQIANKVNTIEHRASRSFLDRGDQKNQYVAGSGGVPDSRACLSEARRSHDATTHRPIRRGRGKMGRE